MLFHAKRKRRVRLPAAGRRLRAVAFAAILILLGAIGYAGYLVAAGSLAWAQDATQAPDATQTPDADAAGPQPDDAKPVAMPAKPKVALHRTKPRQTARLHAVSPAQRPAQNFAARLEAAGATACARRIDELADASMQGTTATADASSWFVATPNERAVNVVIA